MESGSGLLFTSGWKSIVGPSEMSRSREAFLFARIVGRKVSLFASRGDFVRKPLHLTAAHVPAKETTERLIWEEHIFSPVRDKAQRARQDENPRPFLAQRPCVFPKGGLQKITSAT